jgi:lipopolysaccharide transport system ATP-binding protein
MGNIAVEKVSKKFRVPHEKKSTIFQNLIGLVTRNMAYEEFWALSDVSFEVKKGETFGILGKNGSGKSTLLKVLAQVLYPDGGTVKINGRVASFLELGVGFQPELTAKENVHLYSSILGISRKEINLRYEEILDFAELKKFENMKLKNFSSGMYVRLAFSTAVHAHPDTLLIDEVFAVGDESFQNKCKQKMDQFKKDGKTIIFVSHDLASLRKICDRCMLLNQGKVIKIGGSDETVDEYLAKYAN